MNMTVLVSFSPRNAPLAVTCRASENWNTPANIINPDNFYDETNAKGALATAY